MHEYTAVSKKSGTILPCSTPGYHHRIGIHHHHVQHPRKLGWCNRERCVQVDHTVVEISKVSELGMILNSTL